MPITYYNSGPTWFIKTQQTWDYTWSSGAFRKFWKHQDSGRGLDRETPRAYSSNTKEVRISGNNGIIDPRGQPINLDAPNMPPLVWCDADGNDPQHVHTQNKCRAKFGEAVNEKAELALLLAERKKAADLIGDRADNLSCLFKNLFRKRWRKAADCVGINKPSASRIQRNLNRVHLEYDYGWKPLLNDIHSAVKIVEAPYPESFEIRVGTRTRNWVPNVHTGYGYVGWLSTHSTVMGAQMRVSNPALYAATSAGLTNPLSVAWELVPFSFMVDWFIPIGAAINSLTDLLGVELSGEFTTNYRQHIVPDGKMWMYDFSPINGKGYKICPYYAIAWDMERILDIPSPIVNFSTYAFSASKALNALSVLSAVLSGKPTWLK